MPRVAFVFPGQGSQAVGMGRPWVDAFAGAREVFRAADEALGLELSTLCWEGPAADLQLTANTQPAILTASLAVHAAVAERGLEPVLMAGHSLGEYSALVAAGALDFADAVRLVRRRGQLMQEAVPVGEGAMAAILGLDEEAVRRITAEAAGDEVCAVANLNSPVQTVIAGHAAAVERAMELAGAAGARGVIPLAVSAPFHSPLMAPARAGLEPRLAATDFRDPAVPVVTNIDARPAASAAAARDALARQIDGPVRWVESIRWMIDEGGVDAFVEIGPGAVLSGLIRRIERGVTAISVAVPDDLAKLAELEA
ncbi:MAG: ACP S-malonyltransferase [Acidobacteriota bacterium]|nr:ACP S-malonyltransferase [Acidobacteriota bacterium]MDH3522923.1 ACP S-malonyltransferase [Acidobacteriota bacterium]